jgi:aspartyl-tRNA(Asn)/glutamyl-tRNA(Gln) amidotransferase subunit A
MFSQAEITIGLPGALPMDVRLPGNVKRVTIELKYIDLLPQAFYILCAAEICNNATRYDGVKFGYRAEGADGIEDLYTRSRADGLGKDIKLASIVGCMALSKEHYGALYHKSMQIRRLAQEHYLNLFEEADAIALPSRLAGRGKFEQLALYTLPAMGGFASISLPCKEPGGNDSGSESPGAQLGAQLICKRGNEGAMFALANAILQVYSETQL